MDLYLFGVSLHPPLCQIYLKLLLFIQPTYLLLFCLLKRLTGNALESDINTFLNAGADNVLVKPFSMDEFASAMASVAIRMATELPTPSRKGSVLGMLSDKGPIELR